MRQHRHALLIGINKYPRIIGNDLQGCLNDTAVMSALLRQRHGFTSSEITTLHDEQATQQGIRDALAKLLAETETDDLVIFFYAGHGSRIRDQTGTKLSGFSETLVPHDGGRWTYANRDIVDDELQKWLLAIEKKTRYVTLIFDCCHSATVHRSGAIRTVEADDRAPTLSPASAKRPAIADFDTLDAKRHWLASIDRYVVLSACQDHELAAEMEVQDGDEKIVRGIFTHWLTQNLARATPRTTYRDVFERTVAHTGAMNAKQHPSCEGALDRLIFGTEDLSPAPYVFVRQETDGEVYFDAGRIHGLAVGARFTLHPSAFDEDDATFASRPQVELTSVSELSAHGRIAQGRFSLQQGRAVLSARPSAAQWSLALSDEAARVLGSHIDASPWLRRSGIGDTPVAQIEVADSCFSVRDCDGKRLTKTLPRERAATVIDELERLAHRAMVRALTNPHSQLRDAVQLSFFRRNSRDELEQACSSVAAPLPTPQTLYVQLRNQQARVLYVALLHVASDGSISTPLQPEHGSAELGLGLERWLGSLSMTWPDASRLIADARGPVAEVVCERFLLFVSTQPLDLRLLLRGAPHTNLDDLQTVMRSSASDDDTSVDWTIETHEVYITQKI